MVAIVFLPLGAVTRDREHLEVELFTQHLPPRRLAFYQSFGALIGAIYTAVILWQATKIALKMTRLGEVWETATFDIPVWSSRWFFVLGASLMLIYLILQAVDHFVYATRGEHFLPDRRPPKATEGMDTVEVDAIAVGKGGASAD
jgi:TRAP-type C4-dicarboxylate transport system permease small subunit